MRPVPEERAKDASRRRRRRLFWLAYSLLAVVTFVASAHQKYPAVERQVREADFASELDDPALLGLATSIAFVIAGVVTIVLLGVYLSICSAIDTKVLPGLTLAIPVLGMCGPAMAVGVLSTLPVAVVSLLTASSSPKDSIGFAVYLLVTVLVVLSLFLYRVERRLSRSRALLAGLTLVVVAALSYVL